MRSPRAAVLPVLASALLAVSLAAPLGLSPAGAQAAAKPGHSRGSDPYFPRQGNTGYGVAKYNLHLNYRTSPKRISGVATLRARARQNLSSFTLDLRRNMKVSSVTVDGRRAAFSQPKKYVQELRIRPRTSIPDNKYFTVAIQYGGKVRALRDPNGSLDGMVPTNDGVVVVSEPQGAPTWYPVNDTPRDKATYDITVSAPKSLKVISNGALRAHVTHGSRTAWHWTLGQATSSYLVTLAIGKFTLKSGRSKSGIPYWYAIDPKQGAGRLTRTTAIIDYFASKFGKYPYGQTGGIVENKPSLGYNLETATRPVYDRAPDIRTLAHELAHQWFGDSVTLERWRDIWLNEGFAQFAMWLYDEHRGSTTAHQRLRRLMSVPASNTGVWNPPPGNPRGPKTMFAGSVYNRGAGTLQALRQKLPDTLFFSILRGWASAHKHGNARVPQFIRYVNKRSHRNLDHFFHEWLYSKGKPST